MYHFNLSGCINSNSQSFCIDIFAILMDIMKLDFYFPNTCTCYPTWEKCPTSCSTRLSKFVPYQQSIKKSRLLIFNNDFSAYINVFIIFFVISEMNDSIMITVTAGSRGFQMYLNKYHSMIPAQGPHTGSSSMA